LRGLRKHTAADAAFAQARALDPDLLTRMRLDPLVATLLAPPDKPGLRERVRQVLKGDRRRAA
ncbi:MAG TPA: hypothetical protein PK794_10075, partial [Armatimonadota bacterium]|nr:hypothetical protein [Armatimonadota bacterium]